MLAALALFAALSLLPASAASGTSTPQPVPTHLAGPHDPPRILGVLFTPAAFGSGDVVHGRVFTSSNVASVEARVGAFATNLQRARPGEFALEYRVPWVPFFLHHDYDVAVTARNADGVTTTKLVPITLR